MIFFKIQYLPQIFIAALIFYICFTWALLENRKDLFFFWKYRWPKSVTISICLFFIAELILFFLILDPRYNDPVQEIKSNFSVEKSRVLLVLDLSKSMLAQDLKPNRLSRAVNFAKELVNTSSEHVYGLGLFSDSFHQLVPFTDDKQIIIDRLQLIEEAKTLAGGTSFSIMQKGLELQLSDLVHEQDPVNVIVLSDGDFHSDLNYPRFSPNMYVYCIIFSSSQGSYLPKDMIQAEHPIKSSPHSTFLKQISLINPYFKVLYHDQVDYADLTKELNKNLDEFYIKSGQKLSKSYAKHFLLLFMFCNLLSLVFLKWPKSMVYSFLFFLLNYNSILYAQIYQKDSQQLVLEKISADIKEYEFKNGLSTINQMFDLKQSIGHHEDFNRMSLLLADGNFRQAKKILDSNKIWSSDTEMNHEIRKNILAAVRLQLMRPKSSRPQDRQCTNGKPNNQPGDKQKDQKGSMHEQMIENDRESQRQYYYQKISNKKSLNSSNNW